MGTFGTAFSRAADSQMLLLLLLRDCLFQFLPALLVHPITVDTLPGLAGWLPLLLGVHSRYSTTVTLEVEDNMLSR